jgi:transposase
LTRESLDQASAQVNAAHNRQSGNLAGTESQMNTRTRFGREDVGSGVRPCTHRRCRSDLPVTVRAPGLLSLYGVGPDTAALLLIAAGDRPERLRSEAAWAHMCAVAPIPASSGKTRRHRLNRGGNREANHALWRIVITRMSAHPATRAYAGRRTAEGLPEKEIIRCLKRYVAREVYPHLRG